MSIYRHFHLFIYFLTALGCARQSSPTGGPKDTIPPRLLVTIPAHQTTNYSGKQIELLFSEMVQVDNPREELIISPSIGKDYKVEARNNRVILTLENNLEDSTTYTFNFREAVKDVTEKNTARNLRLAISTGSYVDSMSVEGKVITVLDEREAENITVMLTPFSDTFNILKHPAPYMTKTDEKGNYKIENLKPGQYLIHAVADANKNLMADSKNEAYGFLPDAFLLDNQLKGVNLSLTKMDARALKLTSARPYNTYFNIKFSKNLKSIKIANVDKSPVFYGFSPTDNSSVQVYNTLKDADSILTQVVAEDSMESRIDTTLYVRFSDREVTPEKFAASVTDTRLLPHRGRIEASWRFSKPIKEINFDSLYFEVDSMTTIRFKPGEFSYDEPGRTLKLTGSISRQLYPEPADTEVAPSTSTAPAKKFINRLVAGRGTFLSADNDSSARLTTTIQPQQLANLGVILAETTPGPVPVIMQLMADGKILRSIRGFKVTFEDVEPGKYQLRMILDQNNNGVWDNSNYPKKRLAERIVYWKNEKQERDISLKENFEIGPLLISY